MDKKEIEQKNEKEKIKMKPKQEIKKQEYSVEEFVQQAEQLFQTKSECVIAAFQIAGVKQATKKKKKKIVKSFLEMEV